MIFVIKVLGKGSWRDKKLESFDLESPKLESFHLSWKVPIVGEFSMQY